MEAGNIGGSASFRDNPALLNIFSKCGLHFVWLEKEDIVLEENKLNPETQKIIKAADESRVLLNLSVLDDIRQRQVLNSSKNPLILLSPDLPSQECLD